MGCSSGLGLASFFPCLFDPGGAGGRERGKGRTAGSLCVAGTGKLGLSGYRVLPGGLMGANDEVGLYVCINMCMLYIV